MNNIYTFCNWVSSWFKDNRDANKKAKQVVDGFIGRWEIMTNLWEEDSAPNNTKPKSKTNRGLKANSSSKNKATAAYTKPVKPKKPNTPKKPKKK